MSEWISVKERLPEFHKEVLVVYDGKRSYADYLFTRAVRKPPQSWCYVEG